MTSNYPQLPEGGKSGAKFIAKISNESFLANCYHLGYYDLYSDSRISVTGIKCISILFKNRDNFALNELISVIPSCPLYHLYKFLGYLVIYKYLEVREDSLEIVNCTIFIKGENFGDFLKAGSFYINDLIEKSHEIIGKGLKEFEAMQIPMSSEFADVLHQNFWDLLNDKSE